MTPQKFDSILAKPNKSIPIEQELAQKMAAVTKHAVVDILNDQPATQDAFDYKALVKTVSGVVLSEQTQTPITIAVDGEWGMGKTSVLKMVEAQARLIGVPCIWLNAWGLESTRNMIQVLGLEIENELIASGKEAVAKQMPKYLNADYVLTSRSFRELTSFLQFPIESSQWEKTERTDKVERQVTQNSDITEKETLRILIVTVTKVETQAIFQVFLREENKPIRRKLIGNKVYYELGIHYGASIFMVQSETGSSTLGGSLVTIGGAIHDLQPQVIIMCGLAFGLQPAKQKLGDILVATKIMNYETRTVKDQIEKRGGEQISTSPALLERSRSASLDWQDSKVHFGLMLSGEKLINSPAARNQLLQIAPEAIGGDMEGAGLFVAATNAQVDFILIKSICDWADGNKNDAVQKIAALQAAKFVLHMVQIGGWNTPREGYSTESNIATYDAESSKLSKSISNQAHWNEVYQSQFTSSKNRVIVFIDDIDRALPDQIANMFKNLKLILEVPNCIFILAMDMQRVARAIEDYYVKGFTKTTNMSIHGDLHDSSIVIEPNSTNAAIQNFGSEYLEKMIQIKFRVPRLSRRVVNEYLIDQGIASEILEIIRWAPDQEVLNPRRLKMYINRLSVKLQLINALRLPNELDNYLVLKTMAFRRDHPEIFQLLSDYKWRFPTDEVIHLVLLKTKFEAPTDPDNFIEYIRDMAEKMGLVQHYLRATPILDYAD